MNQKIKEDLLDWAKAEKNEIFERFINFLSYAEENKKQMELSYCNKTEHGSIEKISFIYNRRFLDFDFSIKLTEQNYISEVEYIYMDSIKQISDQEYNIIDRDGDIFSIKMV